MYRIVRIDRILLCPGLSTKYSQTHILSHTQTYTHTHKHNTHIFTHLILETQRAIQSLKRNNINKYKNAWKHANLQQKDKQTKVDNIFKWLQVCTLTLLFLSLLLSLDYFCCLGVLSLKH